MTISEVPRFLFYCSKFFNPNFLDNEKKYSVLLVFLTFCSSIAQIKRIKFSYDDAGNQISRVVMQTAARISSDTIPKTKETITNKDYFNDGALKDIAYYPNPVKEQLFLKWTNTNEKTISSLSLCNINGQLVQNLVKLENSENEIISFQTLSQGIYTLLVNYTSAKIETFKIVKN